MPRVRDPYGRFIKNPPRIEIGSSYTPATGNPPIEELIEKQRSGQRLTLIERQTLSAWETKQKFSTSGKPKEKGKKSVFPTIDPPIFPQLEPPPVIETNQTMAEGHGSVHLNDEEQRAENERQKREWGRKREEDRKT